MTAAELDRLEAAARLHMRRSVGTAAGIAKSQIRAAFARLRREMGVV